MLNMNIAFDEFGLMRKGLFHVILNKRIVKLVDPECIVRCFHRSKVDPKAHKIEIEPQPVGQKYMVAKLHTEANTLCFSIHIEKLLIGNKIIGNKVV